MWNLDWSSVKFLSKEQRNSTWRMDRMVSDIKRDTYLNSALSSVRLEQLTPKILNQNSNSHKGVGLWAKSINHFGNFGRHFPCATSAKIHAAMYARVPQSMAQFVLKIEKLSHIMAPIPILEIARAYGLHPRLWLLIQITCTNNNKIFHNPLY